MPAGVVTVTFTGNLAADPELRFTASGHAVASFSVACTPRNMNRQTNEWEDGETTWMRCSVWRQAAENTAESLSKGMKVSVQGRLKQRSYDKDGVTHTVYEVDVEEVGPSLSNATATVTKANRAGGTGGGEVSRSGRGSAGQGDPWATGTPAAGGTSTGRSSGYDEPPF